MSEDEDCPNARYRYDYAYLTGQWTATVLLSQNPSLHIHWMDEHHYWHCCRDKEPTVG